MLTAAVFLRRWLARVGARVRPSTLRSYGWRVLAMLYAHEARLGLPRVPVHDLRHSAASAMLAVGISLEDVSK